MLGTRQGYSVQKWVAGTLGALFIGVAAAHEVMPRSGIVQKAVVDAAAAGVTAAEKLPTRILRLENGLQVSLTHKADADDSAAALGVGTGYFQDPPHKPGLAHYHEHMLFLGTKKFPVVGGYQDFITANGGSSNAGTGGNITFYFFNVRHQAFDEALDRFSDFFKTPLFDGQYAAREVNAVNSEFQKNIENDRRRIGHLQNQMARPGHPLQKFGTGNAQTLAGDNRADLRTFFETYYNAPNMRLALISNLSLDAQEAMVRKHFAALSARPVEPFRIDPDFRPALKDQYRLLRVKTLKNTMTLTMDFPAIRFRDYQDSKPQDILGTLIGNEGKGSLLSLLKKEDLVTDLAAGGDEAHPDMNEFSINITLTKNGLKNYETVMERVYQYLDMLRQTGVAEYTYAEARDMAQIGQDWKRESGGADYVATRVQHMMQFKPEALDTAPYLFSRYDPAAYRALLDRLVPGNMMVTLASNNQPVDAAEPVYGTGYTTSQVGGAAFDRLVWARKHSDMAYPVPNGFMPGALSLSAEIPHLALDTAQARVWSLFDNRFRQPAAYLSLRVATPQVGNSVDNAMRAQLLVACVNQSLNEQAYPMGQAGLSFSLGLTMAGLEVNLGGYKNRLADLARFVASGLTGCHLNEASFETHKADLIRGIENRQKDPASRRVTEMTRELFMPNYFSDADKLAALRSITLSDVKDYAGTFLAQNFVTGMAHGNWDDNDVRAVSEGFIRQIGGTPLAPEARVMPRMLALEDGERITLSRKIDDNNNGLFYLIQAGSLSVANRAAMMVVEKAIEPNFYQKMRTEQQLGYIVWSYSSATEDHTRMNFVIQSSDYGPAELQKRVEAWMKDSTNLFDSLSNADFEELRAGVVSALIKAPESLGAAQGKLFSAATSRDADFAMQEKILAAVRALTLQEVRAMGRAVLQNADLARAVIHVRARNSAEPPPAGAIDNPEPFKNRRSAPAVRPTGPG